MKTFTLIFALLVVSMMPSFAQPAIQWQYSFGGTLEDGFNNAGTEQNQLCATADGGLILVGYSHSNDGDVTGHHGLSTSTDCWVVKLDSLGSLEWQRSLGGTNNELGHSIIQTADGGYLLAAETLSDDGDVTGFHPDSLANKKDAWIVKLDPSGNIVWENAFGGIGNDIIHSLIETADGYYIGAGRTSTLNNGDVFGNHGAQDILLLKIDTAGNLIWQKCIGGTSSDYAYTIRQTADNGFVIAGDVNSSNGDFTGAVINFFGATFVMKLDTAADIEWFGIYGGNSLEFGYDVFQTADGGYFHGIGSNSSDLTGAHGSLEYAIYRLDSAGNQIWQQCYGGTGGDWFKNFQPTADGGAVLIGQSNSVNGDISGNIGQQDAWVVKIDSLGAIEWERSCGGTDPEDGTSILVTPDGGYFIGVASNSNNGDVSGHHGALAESDIWIAKLAPVTSAVPEAVENITSLSVAPVPVSTLATISFQLKYSASLGMEIFDMKGDLIYAVKPTVYPAGNTSLRWELSNEPDLASGLYLIKLTGETFTKTVKVVVTK